MGSPGFMSPEQAEGDQVGPPSDIFSLGAVLAFAASGEEPFGTGSSAALAYRVVHAPPRLDGVPDQIRRPIERCLAKDSSQRPSASDLLAEVGAVRPMTGWLPGTIAGAVPDGPVRVEAKPRAARRPRFPRPLILGAAATSMLIAAVATWLATAGGPGRPASGVNNKAAMTAAPPAVSASVRPTASGSPRSAGTMARPSSSGRPGTQSATPGATSPAAATRSAIAPSSRPARTPAYSLSYSGASEFSCADEGSVRSSGGAPAQFTFTDNGSAEVEIASIDANGVLTPSAVIDTGGTLTVSTGVGDYWVIEKSAGGCLAVFEINGAGRVVVG